MTPPKWLQRWQQQRAMRYLQRHHDLVITTLRQDPELTARAIETWMDAAARSPQRETAAYPILSHLGYAGRAPMQQSVPKTTPYVIRHFSQQPPARRAINAIKNPILDMPFGIELRRPIGRDRTSAPPQPTAEQQARIEAVTDMFMRPNDDQNGREFLDMLIEDILIFGAGPIEVQENKSDMRPLFLWPVDAQSIRINVNWQPNSRDFRYSQGRGFVYTAAGTTDDIKLRDEELIYIKLNARSSTPFGLGYLEVAFDTVNAFMGAFAYAEQRSSNSVPNFGIFLGENVPPEQVRRWQEYWENEIEGRGKIPILGGGRSPSVFSFAGSGEDPLWIRWQEFLIRIVAMSFGISPMRLGLERDINRSTAEQGASDDWSTISPIANTLREYFTHRILWKALGYTDLEFVWQVRMQDESKQASVLLEQYKMNSVTIDEIREIYERPPLPDGIGQMTRSAYEMMMKGVFAPQPTMARPGQQPGASQAASAITPFMFEGEEDLRPGERAFIRELLCEEYGERVAAG